MLEISGYLLDTRKRHMLPSSFAGKIETPQIELGGYDMAAWISNERNKPALLSTWPED